MPKPDKFEESTTYQAVCTKGDFSGEHQLDKDSAEIDAANHTSKPGKANHVVKIITTVKTVHEFVKKPEGT